MLLNMFLAYSYSTKQQNREDETTLINSFESDVMGTTPLDSPSSDN